MPVKKSTEKNADKPAKKPVVKRNTEKKETKHDSDTSGSESEHERDNHEVEVVEEKPKKKTSKVVAKPVEKEVENDWGAQSDEDFDVADPPMKVQEKEHHDEEDDHDQENTKQSFGQNNNQRKPKNVGAKYNKYGFSPSLNYNHKDALECSDPVNVVSTNRLFEIIIARTKADRQYKLHDVMTNVYRAKNSECEYPTPVQTGHQYYDQEPKQFGQPYKGNKPNPNQGTQNFGGQPNFNDRKPRK